MAAGRARIWMAVLVCASCAQATGVRDLDGGTRRRDGSVSDGAADAVVGPPGCLLDEDGDGYAAASCGGPDCDDHAPSRYPDAMEECNLEDDDCDGTAADELGCGQRLYRLPAGGDAWQVDYVARIARGAGAPPDRGIVTAWSLCDLRLVCVASTERWYCSTDLVSWLGNTWASITSSAPAFERPTWTVATSSAAAVPSTIWWSAGARWWSFQYTGAPAGSPDAAEWDVAFASWFGAADQTDWDHVWPTDPSAARPFARVLDAWTEERSGGAFRYLILRDDGVLFQYDFASMSTQGWLSPAPMPQLALPGAPAATSIAATARTCSGDMLVITSDDGG